MKCERCNTEHESLDKNSELPNKCIVCNYPMKVKSNVVNSPSHYTQGKYETIDIILDTVQHLPGKEGYLVGNIIKYMSRYHFKNGKEDLQKAQQYLEWLLEIVEPGGVKKDG